MTRDTIKQEAELKAAGWTPLAAHPVSPLWRAPDGQLYPGPGYAWHVMKSGERDEQKENRSDTVGHQD